MNVLVGLNFKQFIELCKVKQKEMKVNEEIENIIN